MSTPTQFAAAKRSARASSEYVNGPRRRGARDRTWHFVTSGLHAAICRARWGIRASWRSTRVAERQRVPRRSHVLLRLERETRPLHPEADFPWLALMAFDVTRTRYLDQLVASYGFEAPIEAALALTPKLAEVIDVRPRARSGFIVEDLLELGLTPAKIARLPQCRGIAPFRDPGEALGWLYVIERTTLLHDAIRTHIAARVPMIAAWSYLSAYREVASLRWQDLGRTLDDYAITPAAAAHVIVAARGAFLALREWNASEPAGLARAAWARDPSQRIVRS